MDEVSTRTGEEEERGATVDRQRQGRLLLGFWLQMNSPFWDGGGQFKMIKGPKLLDQLLL